MWVWVCVLVYIKNGSSYINVPLIVKHRENGLAELPDRLRPWASPQGSPENSELHASLKLFSFMDQLVMTREQWMYKAGRKLLAVRGWEEFQGSWGLNSASLQVGKGGLLSVFTQLFLFEQQPHWLWCKNKLNPKPLLATSWLSVYCLSTHTEKWWNWSYFSGN